MPYTRLPATMAVFILTLVWSIAISTQARQQKGPCIGSYPCPTPTPTASPTRPPVTPPHKPTASPAPYPFTVSLPNDANFNLEMMQLPGGEFTMGSDNGSPDERPPHLVRVSRFAIGIYEVTQAQWLAVMGGGNPSSHQGDNNLPVENITWQQANDFCARLSNKTRQKFRLPTEAEWEYAARAGTKTEYSFDDPQKVGDYAWFLGNSGGRNHSVLDLKKSNSFGLFNMYGNVWEWCLDWYSVSYYSELAAQPRVAVDPQGPRAAVSSRVMRGGSSGRPSGGDFRSASRRSNAPGTRSSTLGFRVAKINK